MTFEQSGHRIRSLLSGSGELIRLLSGRFALDETVRRWCQPCSRTRTASVCQTCSPRYGFRSVRKLA